MCKLSPIMLAGGFEWERKPSCCDQLEIAVEEEKFILSRTSRKAIPRFIIGICSTCFPSIRTAFWLDPTASP